MGKYMVILTNQFGVAMIVAYLRTDCQIDPRDFLGFIVLDENPDNSGTIPVKRREDGEYMCIQWVDVANTITDNLWIRFYNYGVEINPAK